jgi:hypothetical protein
VDFKISYVDFSHFGLSEIGSCDQHFKIYQCQICLYYHNVV